MSFIELPLEGTMEEQSVPEGIYSLRIEDVKEKTNEESGRFSLMAIIRIDNPPEDNPNPAGVFHFLATPNGDDDKKASDFMMLQIKRFLVVFGIPFEGNGFSTEDMPGATAEVLLMEEEYEGQIKNVLRLPAIEE